jgi:hypothetical protein
VKLQSEIIDLVSEGYFYPIDHPLSSGKIRIYPITAQHEELLGNVNLIKRKLLEKEFLTSMVDGELDYDTLLNCDKESILLNLRIANYGAGAKLKARCDDCEADFEFDMSFGFRSKPFYFLRYTRGLNKLEHKFAKANKTVYYKLPNVKEYNIYEEYGWLAFAKSITLSIDGIEDIDSFYNNVLPASDSSAFRTFFEKNTPGYQTGMHTNCPSCKAVKKSKMDINTEIFGIGPESKLAIHSEIFDLCYYSNGAFTQEGVYNMPANLRSFYIKKLVDAKKAEKEANEAASKGGGPAKIARPPTAKR